MTAFRRLVLALMLAALPAAARAEIHLDQLSDCASLRQVQAALRSPAAGCGPPRTAVERDMARRVQAPFGRICFLRDAPSDALAEFDCFVVENAESRSLVCNRPAHIEDVADYRQNYTSTLAPQVKAYLDAGAACELGRLGPTTAVPPNMPLLMRVYARFAFGWVMPVGSGVVGDTTIFHGYGHGDPDLFDAADPVVEVFATWIRR